MTGNKVAEEYLSQDELRVLSLLVVKSASLEKETVFQKNGFDRFSLIDISPSVHSLLSVRYGAESLECLFIADVMAQSARVAIFGTTSLCAGKIIERLDLEFIKAYSAIVQSESGTGVFSNYLREVSKRDLPQEVHGGCLNAVYEAVMTLSNLYCALVPHSVSHNCFLTHDSVAKTMRANLSNG